MLVDNQGLKDFIIGLYPNFIINSVAKKSGQRVVYFGHFIYQSTTEPDGCLTWGPVVLKISEASSRAAISYIQKEVEVLNEINSPFFPKVLFSELIVNDPISDEPLDPIRYISIEERITAEPLTNCLSMYKNELEVLNFLDQIIKAMSNLWSHPQKLVHRDIKPDNILIRENKSIVVIDLGILRQEGTAGVTNSLIPIGPCTPAYASPEQAMNEKKNISFKSDLFSIGIVAYEMLSGNNPFICSDGDNYVEDILNRVCNYTPPNLIEVGVSQGTSKIIEKMMYKEPYKRYRTIEKIMNDLINSRSNLCQ